MPKREAGWLLGLHFKQRGGYTPAGVQMGPKPVANHLIGTW